MISLFDAYELFNVSAPDTTSIDNSFSNFVKNSRAVDVVTRVGFDSFVREGFDFYHSDDARQLAKDYLQGCFSDYFFVQGTASWNTTDYFLYIGDIDFNGDSLFLVDADGFLFRYQNSQSDVYRDSRNGSITFPSLGIVNGSGSSSSSPSHSEKFSFSFPLCGSYSSTLSVYRDHADNEIFELPSADSFYYSSFENTPHLIEGVQNYAFVAALVCFGVFVFKLVDRIFRRVY